MCFSKTRTVLLEKKLILKNYKALVKDSFNNICMTLISSD